MNQLPFCKNICENDSQKKGLKVWNQPCTFVNQILLSALGAKDGDPVNMQEAVKLPKEDTAKHA